MSCLINSTEIDEINICTKIFKRVNGCISNLSINYFVSIRFAIANNYKADLFISIHANAAGTAGGCFPVLCTSLP